MLSRSGFALVAGLKVATPAGLKEAKSFASASTQ